MEKNREKNPLFVFIFVSLLTFAVDQLSKAVAEPLFLSVLNSNLALKTDLGINPLLVTLLIWVLLCYLVWRAQYLNWISGLIIGGGASNLVDRIILGGVRDWFPMPFLGGANNVADWAISLGCIAYIIVQLKTHQDEKKRR
ncbi:MAG TPA: signal peptidase II [Candidatus Woesebacteria bacterium]|nr:signal peptidase II [Candidatus Woesebacteria bacterium]